MAFEINNEIIIGAMSEICPVISNAITATDIVWVAAPAKLAAPTTAYPPKMVSLNGIIKIDHVKGIGYLARYNR